MKMLIDDNIGCSKEEQFNFSLRSKTGVKIKVGNKFFNITMDVSEKYNVTEFVPEFELTEDEFKNLNIVQ